MSLVKEMKSFPLLIAAMVFTFLFSPPGSRADNLFVLSYGSTINLCEFTNNVPEVLVSNVAAYGFAINLSGDIFTVSGGNIYEYATNGARSTFATGQTLYPFPLIFYGKNNLYACNANDNNLYIYATNGTRRLYMDNSSGEYGFDAFAFDYNNNLFEADSFNDTIHEIIPAGGIALFATNLPYADALAFDNDNNLYAILGNTNMIYKIAGDGTFTPFAAVGSSYDSPVNLVFDSQGNLFVADDNGIDEFKNLGGDNLSTTPVNYSSMQVYNLAFAPVIPQPALTSVGNDQFAIYWPAGKGFSMMLQTSTNLNSTNWTTVSNGTLNVCITLSNAVPNAFYRLQTQ